MDQSRSLTAQLGYDESEWIDRSCQLYSSGVNASEPDASQVAHDDRNERYGVDGLNADAPPLEVNPLPRAMIDTGLHGHVMPDITDTKESSRAVDQLPYSNLHCSSRFVFKSGSVVLEDNSKVANKRNCPKPNTGIKCDYPGCKYRGTFNRKYDLQRHMAKHQNIPKEKCPLELCDRFFLRYDKLLAHLKNSHVDEEQAICPISRCSMRMPFMLLIHHIGRYHYNEEIESIGVKACRSMRNDFRSCPISSCPHRKEKLPILEIHGHLKEHDLDERNANHDSMVQAGHHPVSLSLVCPVCDAWTQDLDAFEDHVQAEHIFNSKQGYRDLRGKFHGAISVAWRREHLHHVVTRLYTVEPDAHISLLRPYSDYAAHKFAILRLWPQFAQHPLFDEFNPKLVAHNGATSTI